ncbi:hypothetical protein [Brachyspira sp.]|uniref:hypothetical protein n=1 Tax=Brachyspira sp. TaxID=1977261 RepID=UPI00261922EB|nr:hypothetical protein [Brachyspira sp.]
MKKMIFVLTILSFIAVVSCNSKQGPIDKPLTSNVPSDDKTKKEGTPLADWDGNSKTLKVNASIKANNVTYNQDGYTLLERLYNTVWYQSESDFDDGRLETEEEFVLFDPTSKMVKREYENGRMDEKDEYSSLKHIEDIALKVQDDKKSRNACIVQNIEKDNFGYDVEYEGYYLEDRDTLYIVDGDNIEMVKLKLNDIINGNTTKYRDDKFVLSTKPL